MSSLPKLIHCHLSSVATTLLVRGATIASPLLVGGNRKVNLYLYFFDRLWCEVNWANLPIHRTFVQINGNEILFCRLNKFVCQKMLMIIWKSPYTQYWAGYPGEEFSLPSSGDYDQRLEQFVRSRVAADQGFPPRGSCCDQTPPPAHRLTHLMSSTLPPHILVSAPSYSWPTRCLLHYKPNIMGTEPPCVSITIYSRQSTHPYYVIAHQRHNSLDPYGVFSTTLMTHLYRALVPAVLLLEHLVCSRRCIRKVSSIKLLSEHNFKWKEIKALLFHFRKRVSSKLMVFEWNEIEALLFHFRKRVSLKQMKRD